MKENPGKVHNMLFYVDKTHCFLLSIQHPPQQQCTCSTKAFDDLRQDFRAVKGLFDMVLQVLDSPLIKSILAHSSLETLFKSPPTSLSEAVRGLVTQQHTHTMNTNQLPEMGNQATYSKPPSPKHITKFQIDQYKRKHRSSSSSSDETFHQGPRPKLSSDSLDESGRSAVAAIPEVPGDAGLPSQTEKVTPSRRERGRDASSPAKPKPSPLGSGYSDALTRGSPVNGDHRPNAGASTGAAASDSSGSSTVTLPPPKAPKPPPKPGSKVGRVNRDQLFSKTEENAILNRKRSGIPKVLPPNVDLGIVDSKLTTLQKSQKSKAVSPFK